MQFILHIVILFLTGDNHTGSGKDGSQPEIKLNGPR